VSDSGPRALARRVLDRVDRGGAWATPTLDGELQRAGLDDRDRRLASELVYGVLRHRARIDRALAAHAKLDKSPPKVRTALRVAAYQVLFLDRVPSYAAVDDAVDAARAVAGPKLAGFANAVLRKLVAQREPALPPAGRARIELEHSLPTWIADELASAISPTRDPADADLVELDAGAAAFAKSAPLVARVNRLRTTREALITELATEGVTATPVGSAGLVLEGAGDPSKSASFIAGRWTVQDAGAQHVAELAVAGRDNLGQLRILDACAGVGGKATHLAELTDDRANIDAADLSQTKLDLGAETARRLGLTSIHPVHGDLTDPRMPLATSYDVIVLDAPCTGLGVLRRHPDAKWRLLPTDVARLAAIQRDLLDAVARRLAPGGSLIYSVCTFTRAEGPDQVRALAARTGLRILAESRTWPPAADGFYLAKLGLG